MASPLLTTNYNGDAYDYIIRETVLGNEAIQKGSINVIEDVQFKLSIAKMVSSANPIGAREAMPTTKTATVTWSEATLQPAEMMIYIPDINPRIFEATWRQFQPKGALPNRVLDANIQKAFVDAVSAQAQNQMGRLMWQGNTALGVNNPLGFFNGYITRAIASGTNIDVANLGVITAANIIAIMESVTAAIPAQLFDDPDMVYHMSTTTYRLYQQADRALSFKGSNPQDASVPQFGGREIRYYSGFPNNVILVAKATTGTDSNLYAATDKVRDVENFIIEKLRPEGEFYFLKALFKFDVNFSLDSETVFYIGS